MEDKHIDWLVAAMCRVFARYDANEIVPKTEGDSNGDNNQGQHRSKG